MLDIQSASGVDPDAQAEFCAISESRAERLKAIRAALKKLGPSRIARETDLSRQYLSKLAGGGTAPTDITLSIIEQAVAALEVIDGNRQREVDYAIAWLRNECERVGLRQTATEFELHPGHLSRIISGNRSLTSKLLRFLLSNAGDRQGAQKSNIQTA